MTMTSMVDIDATERVLMEQLQAALAPSFVLIRRVGAGGMGIVYLARDPLLKRLVAVKLMSPERAADPEARARFEREAEAVAAISHPNVVAIYSVGELPSGVPYLVMQYVEGKSMAERLRDDGPLDLGTAKQILGNVASALEAAHRKGIIHRDIKAANILWDDASGRALVSDFGIAAIRERGYERGDPDPKPVQLTQTGMVVGTPRYMSPEQLLSEPVTEKTDIYSLGLLGYELLTGEGPYSVTSPHEIIAAHLRDVPRPITVMRPDADPELESLLSACLTKDAHGRPSAGDIARRLLHGSSTLLEWPPPGLEELHGALARPVSYLVNGSIAVAAPLVVTATAGRGNPLHLGWPQVLVLPSVAAIGALSVVIATVTFAKLLRVAVKGARAGYGWGTIAEVLVDERHDTGALIVGDREYAALTPEQRSTMRRGRVLQAAMRAGAGVWSLAGFFIMLPLASRGLGPTVFALSTLGVSAGLILGAGALARRENRALRDVRARAARSRGAVERLSHLAQTWKDAFGEALGGVGLGQGVVGRVRRRAAGLLATAAITTIAALGAYAIMMFSILGEVAEQARFTAFAGVQQKEAHIHRLGVLRPPIDPSITPLRAGQALQSISFAGVGLRPGTLEKPVAFPIAPIPMTNAFVKGPFAKRWLDGGAIEQAARGLSAEQRKFLEQFANMPGVNEFSILAHAERIDWVAAMIVSPIPEGTMWSALPIPRFARIKQLAYGQVARAALDLADGHPDRAEAALRENIGVTFAMQQGPTLIDNLIGVVLTTIARPSLVSLYEVTGRAAQARAISQESDPQFDEASSALAVNTMKPDDRADYINAIIRDSLSMRGLRWELLEGSLAYEPCRDLRQVLFGPDSLHLVRLAEARKRLVKTPGDNVLMGFAERALNAPLRSGELEQYRGNGYSPSLRSVEAFARSVDMLTGSRRMQSCARLLNFW
jgi:hypothetical protein